MKKSESITALSKAFVKTQKELKQPLKDANNPFFKSKYVPLENVVESITESATKNGLAFSQFPSCDEVTGMITVGTLVMHESGEWIEYDPIKLKPVKNDPQAVGSAITYAKRYALSAIFGITSDQDDDGNEATHPAKKQGRPQTKQKIAPAVATGYEAAINSIIEKTGKNDGSITMWFMKELDVTKYGDITTDQQTKADKLIETMQKKLEKS